MTPHVRTVFLDRDGVLNRTRASYVKSWDEFDLLPDALDSIVALSRHGLDVIVVTNQSAIGRHLVSRATVDDIHSKLAGLVKASGGTIRAFLVCPHSPAEGCDCRKPAPGLFLRARDELGVNLAEAVMIGDQLSDVEAARSAGCPAVLIDTGGRSTKQAVILGAPVVRSLEAAVGLIRSRIALEEAIVLCGGLGTRLGGLLGDRPKSMAPVHGRPFLEWLLLGLRARGVRRVVLATGHLSQAIRDHFQDGSPVGLELAYSTDSTPLGTGGAARLAAHAAQTSPLIVMNGDSYCRFDLGLLRDRHRATDAVVTLWLQRVNRSDSFGSVTTAEDGRVTGFQEKVAGAGAVSAGVYVVDKEVLRGLPSDRAVSLEHDVFPGLVGRGLYAVTGEGPFVDIGTPESLAAAERLLAEDLRALQPS